MGAIHSEVIDANVNSPCHAAISTTERASHAPSYSFAVAMPLTILLPVLHASAFTIDPASGTNADGSSRFVDPDEQIHSSFVGGSATTNTGWLIGIPSAERGPSNGWDRSRDHIP